MTEVLLNTLIVILSFDTKLNFSMEGGGRDVLMSYEPTPGKNEKWL